LPEEKTKPEAFPISFKTSPVPCWQSVRVIVIPCQLTASATGDVLGEQVLRNGVKVI
jgi:hypothetical protein